MGIPVLKKCCCCDLKWGAIIVAIIGFLDFGFLTYSAIQDTQFPLLMRYLAMILGVAFLVACILIIVSLFVPRKELPCVYLVVAMVEIVVLIFDIIFFTVILCTKSGDDNREALKYLITCIITIPIVVYCWWVIYSWYKKLQSPDE